MFHSNLSNLSAVNTLLVGATLLLLRVPAGVSAKILVDSASFRHSTIQVNSSSFCQAPDLPARTAWTPRNASADEAESRVLYTLYRGRPAAPLHSHTTQAQVILLPESPAEHWPTPFFVIAVLECGVCCHCCVIFAHVHSYVECLGDLKLSFRSCLYILAYHGLHSMCCKSVPS